MNNVIKLLNVAKSKALAKAKGNEFYTRDVQVFFKEFKTNVLDKFEKEQTIQDVYDLTLPDYSAIFLMIQRHSYLSETIDDNEQFVMRFIYALDSLKEAFAQEKQVG